MKNLMSEDMKMVFDGLFPAHIHKHFSTIINQSGHEQKQNKKVIKTLFNFSSHKSSTSSER